MALVLAGAWLAMQSLAASKRERTPRPFTPLVYTVETAAAERADNRPDIRLYGQVETGRNVDLRTTVSGDVVEIHPDMVAGRRVAEGTVLCVSTPLPMKGLWSRLAPIWPLPAPQLQQIDARLACEPEQLGASKHSSKLVYAPIWKGSSARGLCRRFDRHTAG